MNLHLSTRDRATLLIGFSLIVLLVLGSRGFPAWLHWQRQIREEAVTAVNEAVASQQAIQGAAHLDHTVAQLEQRYLALAPALLVGDHAAAADAALISVVNRAARSAGVQMGALQVQSDTVVSSGILFLRVRGDGIGDIAGATRFLTSIEGGVPLLSVREWSMTAADPRSGNNTPEAIRFRFIIEGIARTDSAEDLNTSKNSAQDMR